MHLFHLVQQWKFQLSLPDYACKRNRKCSFLLQEFRVQLRSQETHVIGVGDMSLCGEKGLHVSLFNILTTPMWTSSLDLSLELRMSISACLGQAQTLHSGPLEGLWGPHIWPGQNETQCSPSQGPISMKDHQSHNVPSPRKESSSIPPSYPFSTGRQHKSGLCRGSNLGIASSCPWVRLINAPCIGDVSLTGLMILPTS